MKRYAIIGRRPWNRRHFELLSKEAVGHWDFIGNESELAKLSHELHKFRYLFFLHWSSKVPMEIVEGCECVCFHMTDVPYGRGGSPLQNLISRGHRETVLTAMRMTSEFDAGPVYLKSPLSLEGGTAEEIYQRASWQACQMAQRIAAEEPKPEPQNGQPVVFKRRTPEQSRIPAEVASLKELFDHIRMLDAEGYPHAFLDYGPLRLEFRRAAHYNGRVMADVSIHLRNESDSQT